MQPPELYAEHNTEAGSGGISLQYGRKGNRSDIYPGNALVESLSYEVPLCYYKMEESLAVRQVYFYKKRNKYLTKTMEEFIRVAVGDEGFQKSKGGQRERNQEKKSQEKRYGAKNTGQPVSRKRRRNWFLSAVKYC